MNRIKTAKTAFILPVIVTMMTVLVLIGYGLLSLGFNARIKALRHTEDIYAVSAAEAGMTHALIRMNSKLSNELVWNNDTLAELPLSDVNLPDAFAEYSFDITGSPAAGFTIQSTGLSGPAKRVFCATTMLKSVFDFSILVKKNLVLYPNSEVLAYNSKTGETNLDALIGTNSIGDDSVIVMNGATVNGDVLVGPTDDPTEVIKSSGVVTGTVTAMGHAMPFVEPVPPTGLTPQGSINGPGVVTGPLQSGTYSSISLGNDEVLQIQGDVVMYVTGNIEMKNGAELQILENSSLTLYLDGNFDAKEGSGINNLTEVPSNFKLLGTGQNQIIELKAKNNFYGAVYAPNASLGIKAGGDIYGSFVGENFEMKSKSKFKHDKALSSTSINSHGVFFAINLWYEQ